MLKSVYQNHYFNLPLQRLRKDSNPGGAKHNKNHENPWYPAFQWAKLGENTWFWKFQGGPWPPWPPSFASAALCWSFRPAGRLFTFKVSSRYIPKYLHKLASGWQSPVMHPSWARLRSCKFWDCSYQKKNAETSYFLDFKIKILRSIS